MYGCGRHRFGKSWEEFEGRLRRCFAVRSCLEFGQLRRSNARKRSCAYWLAADLQPKQCTGPPENNYKYWDWSSWQLASDQSVNPIVDSLESTSAIWNPVVEKASQPCSTKESNPMIWSTCRSSRWARINRQQGRALAWLSDTCEAGQEDETDRCSDKGHSNEVIPRSEISAHHYADLGGNVKESNGWTIMEEPMIVVGVASYEPTAIEASLIGTVAHYLLVGCASGLCNCRVAKADSWTLDTGPQCAYRSGQCHSHYT